MSARAHDLTAVHDKRKGKRELKGDAQAGPRQPDGAERRKGSGSEATANRATRKASGKDERGKLEQGKAEQGKAERVQNPGSAGQPQISGGNSLRDPPVPIPNTEVKPQHADGTWMETARESRTPPDSTRGHSIIECPLFIFRIICYNCAVMP